MMKYFTLCFLLLSSFCSVAQVAAQTPGKPHFVSLNAGYNYPIGDYKEIKFDSLPAAETQAGYYGSMEFGFYFSRNFGLGINLGAFYNEIDREDFEASFKQQLIDNAQEDLSTSANIETSEWVNVYAMVGPYITIPVSILYIDFKLLGGAMSTQEPLLKMRVDDQGQAKVSKTGEADAIGFGINYGMHLRIQLLQQLGLRLNVEGFSTKQEMESTFHNSKDTFNEDYSKNISAINVGAGLVFTFD